MLDIEVVRLDWFRSEAYQDISPLQIFSTETVALFFFKKTFAICS